MTIRLIQVGMGVRGKQWAQVIGDDPRVENVAYVRRRVDRAKQDLAAWGEPEDTPVFGDLNKALETMNADAVVLVTPPEVHHEQTTATFQAGCHVLAEKPLTEVMDESIDLVRQADERGRLLMVGHNFRYLSASLTYRQMIKERTLGEPGYGHFVYLRNRDGRRPDLNKYPLIMKQPMLLEQSIHHLDLMRYCYDDEVVAVSADTWRPNWSTYQDDCCVSAMLEFASGFHANYMGTWTSGSNQFFFEWRTDCSEGIIVQKYQFDDLYSSTLIPGLASVGELFKRSKDVEPLRPVELASCEAFIDDTRVMLTEFLDAIEGRAPLITSGKDHLKTLGLTLACVEAAETGRKVLMEDFYRREGIPDAWL